MRMLARGVALVVSKDVVFLIRPCLISQSKCSEETKKKDKGRNVTV